MTPPACSAPLEAQQGSAHAEDAQLRPKPCSDFSAFARSLTHSLSTPNLRWRLREPCVELSRASDTLASTRLCDMSPCSHNSPYGLLHLQPSAPLNQWPTGRNRLWQLLVSIIQITKTYCEIVSLDCWKRSPMCLIGKPVMHIYRNIASCSSKETDLESLWPWSLRTVISSSKRSTDNPSSFCIQSGWPVSSSSTHPSLDRMEVW